MAQPAETASWTASLTIGSLALGTLLLVAFVLAERRVSHPLLPLRVILDRTRSGSYVAIGIVGVVTVTSGYPGHILPALLAMGLGFGMIFAPATNTATAGVPTKDSGVTHHTGGQAAAIASTYAAVTAPAQGTKH